MARSLPRPDADRPRTLDPIEGREARLLLDKPVDGRSPIPDDDIIPPRARAAMAGFLRDPQTARALIDDPDQAVRAAALSALVRLEVMTAEILDVALRDRAPLVRRTACEAAARLPEITFCAPLADQDSGVIEAAAFACGERGESDSLESLCTIASSHDDPLCRESAVAALGAIGDPRAKPTVIAALDDIATIRRRAVIALSAFSGEDVTDALSTRLQDRDWQVRQAAEDVLEINAAGAELSSTWT